MGYTTKFKGSLSFACKVEVAMLSALSTMFEDSWDDKVEGAPNYLQFRVTKKMDGIEWDGSEKFYDSVECVNFVIDKMRETWPEFALSGEMKAQGEDSEDRWILRIVDGRAVRIDDKSKGKRLACPECRHRFWVEES